MIGPVLPVLGASVTVAAVAALAIAGWTVRRRLLVVTVDGPSMQPTLQHGDRVLARRVPLAAVRTGDIVVVRRPVRTNTDAHRAAWLIKRAAAVPGEPVPPTVRAAVGGYDGPVPAGRLVVLGDNPPQSADSRHWGYVTEELLLGVVVRAMTGPRRAFCVPDPSALLSSWQRPWWALGAADRLAVGERRTVGERGKGDER